MKKILLLLVILTTTLSLTACFRPRKSNNVQIDTPMAASTQQEPTSISTQTPQALDTATNIPTETTAPTDTPLAAPASEQIQPSAAAESSAELDQTLNELEQLLNNTDTKIDIP